MRKIIFLFVFCVTNQIDAQTISEEQLGQILFFDTSLSLNRNQSCSTCHNPAHAFVDNRQNIAQGMVSLGDDGQSFGNRNAPTAAYAQLSPSFHYDEKRKEYVGGQFLDGRAATLADQAVGPPLNPVEMNMPDAAAIIARLRLNATYHVVFKNLYGEDIWDDPARAYAAMGRAIASYEKTDFFAPFDSKYDKFLRGEYELTVLEDLGRSLFFSNQNVNCSSCHMLKREDAKREPFTDYLYHNVGTPRNEKMLQISVSGSDYIDHGLLDNPNINDPLQAGKFRTPTLRNIAVTAPYMHNGVFKDLRTVVEFYDKYNNHQRQINPETGEAWAEAEVSENIALDLLAAPRLTDRKIDALVAFMKLLTDERYEHLLVEQTAP